MYDVILYIQLEVHTDLKGGGGGGGLSYTPVSFMHNLGSTPYILTQNS